MDRFLPEQAKSPPPAPAAGPTASAGARRSKVSWRLWAVILGALFGLYVYAGSFFLPQALQWSTISGRISGETASAATAAAMAAKASEAAAVASAQETAKVDPQVEIAARTAQIEIAKQEELARIEVAKQARLNALEVAKAPATQAASAYRQCMERAQHAAEAAAANPNTTLGAREISRQIALSQATDACERLKTQEDEAVGKAEKVKAGAGH